MFVCQNGVVAVPGGTYVSPLQEFDFSEMQSLLFVRKTCRKDTHCTRTFEDGGIQD